MKNVKLRRFKTEMDFKRVHGLVKDWEKAKQDRFVDFGDKKIGRSKGMIVSFTYDSAVYHIYENKTEIVLERDE